MSESKTVPFSRIVAYLRKSRADGEQSVEEVLAKHERILQDYCVKTWGSPLPESKLLREVQSGETIASRPVMQQLIRMVQDREVDGVLVVELQRLSRGDLVDVGELSRLFYYTGCQIVTPTRSWDLHDEYDRKFFEMELMHGRDYLDYVKRIMARGRERSVLDGNYINPRAPFGYRRIWVDKRPTLEIVPADAEIVRMIFEWYAGQERLGPSRIADRLNDMGIRGIKTDHWSEYTVRNIINNPIYIGKVTWNHRKEVKAYKNGSIVTTRPFAQDYILANGKHEAIISDDLWERAQESAKTRSHPSTRKDRDFVVNPLAGLLTCSVCGRSMAYKQCFEYKTKKPLAPIFACRSLRSVCNTRGATVSDVIALLIDSLRNSLKNLSFTDLDQPAEDPSARERNVYEAELADLTKQQERLYDFLERGVYDEPTFRRRMSALLEKIEKNRQAVETLDDEQKKKAEREAFRSSLEQCIEVLSDSSASPETINKVLKKVLLRIDYSRDRSPRRKWDPTPITLSLIFK